MSTKQYFPSLFPYEADSSSRRCLRDPQTVLWDQPCPRFQSQFGHPEARCTREKKQTIHLTNEALRQFIRTFSESFPACFISKQPMNMLSNKQPTGPSCLTSLCLGPRLANGTKCEPRLRNPYGDLTIAGIWADLDQIPESSTVNSLPLYWIMLWMCNAGNTQEYSLMFLWGLFISSARERWKSELIFQIKERAIWRHRLFLDNNVFPNIMTASVLHSSPVL